MSNQVVCREVSHAGSWYSASGPQLNAQLEGWLSQVQSTKRPARVIIALHAGYTYCGSCATHAYKQVDPSITQRIFILGPSHHVSLSQCALSSVDIYRTFLYHLHIDQKIYRELWKTGIIETHLPYTSKAMEIHKNEFTIIPILVGALSESKEQEFRKLFSKYLADPSNFLVVSSDFCHWCQRFRYSYHVESQGETYRSIEYLDKMSTSLWGIIKCYHRAPEKWKNMSFSFLNYAQSNQCRNWQDSSALMQLEHSRSTEALNPQGGHLHILILSLGS
uniref:Uncharacterized protein n=1 Tax=Cercocebus atys TaxID=9531 RepID=A0A2K5NXG0_CERAT